MKAVVTSIGEVTTKLCIWSLERNGFEVVLYEDGSSLADKLERIYKDMNEDFIRVDADVVPNRNLTPKLLESGAYHIWWFQFLCYGWFKQDIIHGGVQYVRRLALPALRDNVGRFRSAIRPETELSRVPEFYNPRRFDTWDTVAGIHGFAAKDIERIKHLKQLRGQYETYDWQLAERLMELVK